MAAAITSEQEFIDLLRDAKPALREGVYNLIKPHVGYNGPRPFAQMSFEADA